MAQALFSGSFTLQAGVEIRTVAVCGVAEDANAFLARESLATRADNPRFQIVCAVVIPVTDAVLQEAGYRHAA